jgi:ATP-dependent Lon protease
MFVATANMIEGIPYPLYDRMEIINLAGYTDDEKAEIARNFLLPKNLKEYSLTARQFKINNEIINALIAQYTKEAGVRQLERLLATLMRKCIQIFLKDATIKSVTITDSHLKEWLGNAKFKKTSLNEVPEKIGLATGLAYTELGGDVLEIETTAIPGKGGLTLTGQLGEVMQESAHAALSYIRSRALELGLKNSFYSSKDIHVHIPEGATPKDGPSAGITMCVALISALTKMPALPHLAMTGEITLQGRVLGVGGLKEKLLAAKQHNMTHIIVPKENTDDIQEILKEISLEGIELTYVNTIDEVLKHAFKKNPLKVKEKRA